LRVGTVGATGGSHITAVIPLLKREVELPQLGGGGGWGRGAVAAQTAAQMRIALGGMGTDVSGA
jgi:hypothetical protein